MQTTSSCQLILSHSDIRPSWRVGEKVATTQTAWGPKVQLHERREEASTNSRWEKGHTAHNWTLNTVPTNEHRTPKAAPQWAPRARPASVWPQATKLTASFAPDDQIMLLIVGDLQLCHVHERTLRHLGRRFRLQLGLTLVYLVSTSSCRFGPGQLGHPSGE